MCAHLDVAFIQIATYYKTIHCSIDFMRDTAQNARS